MDKKSKVILFLILGSVILLFAIVFYASYQIASIKTNYDQLAESVKSIKVINGIDGTDGKPGLNGSNGYDGLNGVDGKDSVSTSIKETFYMQLPAKQGEKGKDGVEGAEGPSTEIQLNPTTKDLETKKSNEKFWTTIIPCAELLRSCPNVTVGTGNE